MTNKEFEAKLKAMENAEQMIEEIRSAADENAVMEILHKHGLNVTMSELSDICAEDGELSEDQMDAVAGGAKCTYDSWLHKLLWKFGQLIGIHDKNSCPVSQF